MSEIKSYKCDHKRCNKITSDLTKGGWLTLTDVGGIQTHYCCFACLEQYTQDLFPIPNKEIYATGKNVYYCKCHPIVIFLDEKCCFCGKQRELVGYIKGISFGSLIIR